MAIFPIILVDSTSGSASDTAASGAGPATAVSGTTAATDGVNGKTVTITDAVDLSGVATDGSAALYLIDTTAGHRVFDQITAVSGTSGNWTVTVQNGFTISLAGKSWAVGGRRATIASNSANSLSIRLFNNNNAAGDAMPGWAVEMQSGHTETIAATYKLNRAGTVAGPITLRGNLSAATRPVITFSNNGSGLEPDGARLTLQAFELQNSNATKTASIAVAPFSATYLTVDNLKIDHATNKFWKGIVTNGVGALVVNCDVGNTANIGIVINSSQQTVAYNWVHDCGSHGINATGNYVPATYGNVVANCTGSGIKFDTSGTGNSTPLFIVANTCNNNTTNGIDLTTASTENTLCGGLIANNVLSNNGAYGLNFSGTSVTDAAVASFGATVKNNDTFNNTSGAYHSGTAGYTNSNCPWASGDPGLDPQFTSAAGGDYSIGTNLKAQGYPLGGTLHVGTTSSTYSYVDIGAAQRQEPTATTTVQSLILQPTATY